MANTKIARADPRNRINRELWHNGRTGKGHSGYRQPLIGRLLVCAILYNQAQPFKGLDVWFRLNGLGTCCTGVSLAVFWYDSDRSRHNADVA